MCFSLWFWRNCAICFVNYYCCETLYKIAEYIKTPWKIPWFDVVKLYCSLSLSWLELFQGFQNVVFLDMEFRFTTVFAQSITYSKLKFRMPLYITSNICIQACLLFSCHFEFVTTWEQIRNRLLGCITVDLFLFCTHCTKNILQVHCLSVKCH